MNIRDTLSKPAYDISTLLEIVPLSRSWLYSQIAQGKLRVTKAGRRTIFLVDDVAEWLAGLRDASAEPIDQLGHNGGPPLDEAANQKRPANSASLQPPSAECEPNVAEGDDDAPSSK